MCGDKWGVEGPGEEAVVAAAVALEDASVKEVDVSARGRKMLLLLEKALAGALTGRMAWAAKQFSLVEYYQVERTVERTVEKEAQE